MENIFFNIPIFVGSERPTERIPAEMADNDTITKIEGVVEDVLFCNKENGYIVLDLNTGESYVTVVGELGNIEAGEELSVGGRYVNHPKFGVQFRADYCERKLPATSAAILKYLSSGVIKGIGPTTAKRIVEAFGDESLNVIESTPERLADIKGLSRSKAEEIAHDFKRITGIRTLMIFLGSYGIQPSIAVAAWKRWGQFATEVIKANPYTLCESGIELDFDTAETMAGKMGIPKDSESRIRAGITYILAKNTLNGHTCLPYKRLSETAQLLLDVDKELLDKVIDDEISEGNLCEYYKEEKSRRRYIFLDNYYRAESYIASRLALMKGFFLDNQNDYSKLIDIEEKTKTIVYAQKQREAIDRALSTGFLILTGGPGTGKTTTLKAIISLFEQRGLSVMICAPTGRAAKRISDLTGYPAKTIHRLLEVTYDSTGQLKFKHCETNTVSCDVMIIDEMSMVDTLLFEALLRAIKLSCRLIMVGDSDQLPSVGAGNILKDMIESGRLSYVRLTEIFRQAQQSCIVTNAHKIVSGEEPDLSRKDSDFFFMQRLNSEDAAATVAELVAERLPDAYGFSPIDDIQVLCPSRKGLLGSVELNKLLQERLNPSKKDLSETKGLIFTYRENDKVMQIKNNYDVVWKKGGENGTGIFNGDIGTIVAVKRRDNSIIIDFEGRVAEYTFDMLDQVELAYAVTVHKSQGSEFNAVILPLLGGFDKLYYRNLLYTAVTRAKKMLIIVGSKSIVMRMVENNRRTNRYTCLREMLEDEIPL